MMTKQQAIRKLWRFAGIYGSQRALNKAIARTRPVWLRNPFVFRRRAQVSVIGCGQFAFSCVCFYVQKHRGNVFLNAFDTDTGQAESLGRYYGFRRVVASPADVFSNPAIQLLYVVSNHVSHSQYAIEGLKRNIDVYVEKPVSVSYGQLVRLLAAQRSSAGQLFAGYNRPYAKAIQLLRQQVRETSSNGGFSIGYVVNGHLIPPDHWYRKPDEGTRVCGNLGHWIDLTVHIWQWRSLPNWIDVQLACANPAEPDDNLCVLFTTDRHDVVSIMLTARTEPFEGISESINLQYGDIIARIDDFRTLALWHGSKRLQQHYRPKDAGHERAVMQPYHTNNRDWREVELSTLLMLHVKDMVIERRTSSRFAVQQALLQLETDVQQESTAPTRVSQP